MWNSNNNIPCKKVRWWKLVWRINYGLPLNSLWVGRQRIAVDAVRWEICVADTLRWFISDDDWAIAPGAVFTPEFSRSQLISAAQATFNCIINTCWWETKCDDGNHNQGCKIRVGQCVSHWPLRGIHVLRTGEPPCHDPGTAMLVQYPFSWMVKKIIFVAQ